MQVNLTQPLEKPGATEFSLNTPPNYSRSTSPSRPRAKTVYSSPSPQRKNFLANKKLSTFNVTLPTAKHFLYYSLLSLRIQKQTRSFFATTVRSRKKRWTNLLTLPCDATSQQPALPRRSKLHPSMLDAKVLRANLALKTHLLRRFSVTCSSTTAHPLSKISRNNQRLWHRNMWSSGARISNIPKPENLKSWIALRSAGRFSSPTLRRASRAY